MLTSLGFSPSGKDIADRVIYLADYARERLFEIGCPSRFAREQGNKSGIVTFDIPGVDPNSVRSACLEADVVVSCRGGGIRVAPHAYNNEDDIQRLVDVVKRFT